MLACTGTPVDTADPAATPRSAGPLELVEILDLNGHVTTKGMDVAADGRVFVWNYNQDDLEVWDGSSL